MPLFLCVVDKKRAGIRVFNTYPRFHLWALGRSPASLELVPSDPGELSGFLTWDGQARCSLGPPLIDTTIDRLLDDEHHRTIKQVLAKWLDVEHRNLVRRHVGQYTASMPNYETNSPAFHGTTSVRGGAGDPTQALASMGAIAGSLVGNLLRRNEPLGAALCAMMERYALGDATQGGLSELYLNLALGPRIGIDTTVGPTDAHRLMKPHVADRLLDVVREALGLDQTDDPGTADLAG
jgi:hypothetical protein